MHAIIETGGKQYNVQEGDIIYVEKLPCADGASVSIDKVLCVFEGEQIKLGAPYVEGVTVTAKSIKTGKKRKILVFKFKAKKNYRRRQGHRQPYTKLQIEKINTPA